MKNSIICYVLSKLSIRLFAILSNITSLDQFKRSTYTRQPLSKLGLSCNSVIKCICGKWSIVFLTESSDIHLIFQAHFSAFV